MKDEPQLPTKEGNGKNEVLLSLAKSSDKAVQFGTLALVGLSGLGSFFQTANLGDQVHRDRDRAIGEIHELYSELKDFEDRQKRLISDNAEQLENQTKILKNQSEALAILRDAQIQYLQRQQRLFAQPPVAPSQP